MLHVYLDQAEWIDLSKAASGKATDQETLDALAIARFGVAHDLVRFPLSSAHYIETMQVKRQDRRQRLAGLMAELSRFVTVVDHHRLLEMELDLALHRRFGRPEAIRMVDVFGFGLDHAFGDLAHGLHSAGFEARLRSDPGLRLARELAVLAGPAEDFPVEWMAHDAARATAERFASMQAERGREFRDAGYGKGRLPRALVAMEIIGFLPVLNDALERAHVPADVLDDQATLTDLYMDLPSQRVTHEMLKVRHRDPHQTWNATDLNDFAALASAIPYCDVVVTERHWRGVLRDAHLDREFSTVILDDVRELPEHIVAGEVAR